MLHISRDCIKFKKHCFLSIRFLVYLRLSDSSFEYYITNWYPMRTFGCVIVACFTRIRALRDGFGALYAVSGARRAP